MPIFISQVKLTQDGLKELKNAPDRIGRIRSSGRMREASYWRGT